MKPFSIIAVFISLLASAFAGDAANSVYYAGLRRSSYSMEKKRPELCSNHGWWAEKAKQFAKSLSVPKCSFRPVIIEIVCIYLDGTCEMEFKRPPGVGKVKGIESFNPDASIDHEAALSAYDKAGVAAIIQIEPGSADVERCLEIVNATFGRHPCVIGFGVDAEWFNARGSKHNAGLPITDDNAKRWMDKVLSFNPKYTLFLKHWDMAHMPPKYRHPNLYFVSDSMDFKSQKQLMEDFRSWGEFFGKSKVGYQFGYKKDAKWWKKLSNPSLDISAEILKEIGNARYLFWVDFTADQVCFSR